MSTKQHITDNPAKISGAPSTLNPSLAEMARGQAVAELLIKGVQEQGQKLRRFLVDIAELSQAGRSGFRVAVAKHLREVRKHVDQSKGTPEHAAYAAAGRSAGVRLSEAVTFSKAIDTGWVPDFEGVPYHSMIGAARTMLASESAVGPTQKRGRKALTPVEKALAFITRLGLKPAQIKDLEVKVHALTVKPVKAPALDAPVKAVSSVIQMPRANSTARASLVEERAAAKSD